MTVPFKNYNLSAVNHCWPSKTLWIVYSHLAAVSVWQAFVGIDSVDVGMKGVTPSLEPWPQLIQLKDSSHRQDQKKMDHSAM